MAERSITYLTDVRMITCVLQNGLAEEVLDAAKNCGAQGATISYARGTGIRDRMGLLGVIRIIVSEEQSDRVFEAMYLAGKLDTPGKGIMYISQLDHVATYIPDSVLNKAAAGGS
jgi:nitrogen regulatory protein P-II 1